MTRAARIVVAGVAAFLASLGVCVAIDRRGLWDNHGWSYYGSREDTAIVYGLGFAALVLCVLAAALALRSARAVPAMPSVLAGLALVLALDLGTPDTVSQAFYDAHVAASVVLFLYQLGAALWLVARVVPTRSARRLLAAQVGGGLVAMLSQLQWIGLLGLGILVYQVAFFSLLVLAVERVSEAPRRALPVGEVEAESPMAMR